MRDALRCSAGLAVLVWWAPTIVLGAATALAFGWGVGFRLRRVDRLIDAGRKAEARRVWAALRRDVEAERPRERRRGSVP